MESTYFVSSCGIGVKYFKTKPEMLAFAKESIDTATNSDRLPECKSDGIIIEYGEITRMKVPFKNGQQAVNQTAASEDNLSLN